MCVARGFASACGRAPGPSCRLDAPVCRTPGGWLRGCLGHGRCRSVANWERGAGQECCFGAMWELTDKVSRRAGVMQFQIGENWEEKLQFCGVRREACAVFGGSGKRVVRTLLPLLPKTESLATRSPPRGVGVRMPALAGCAREGWCAGCAGFACCRGWTDAGWMRARLFRHRAPAGVCRVPGGWLRGA